MVQWRDCEHVDLGTTIRTNSFSKWNEYETCATNKVAQFKNSTMS